MTAAHPRRRVVLAFLLGLLVALILAWVNSCVSGGNNDGPIPQDDDALPVSIDIASFSINGDLESPLEPGLTSALDLKIRNPSDRTLGIQDLAVTVTSVDAPNETVGLPCTVKDFTTQAATGEIVLEGGSTKTLSELGLVARQWPQVSMLNTNRNQNGCKGAILSLTYSGSGVTQ